MDSRYMHVVEAKGLLFHYHQRIVCWRMEWVFLVFAMVGCHHRVIGGGGGGTGGGDWQLRERCCCRSGGATCCCGEWWFWWWLQWRAPLRSSTSSGSMGVIGDGVWTVISPPSLSLLLFPSFFFFLSALAALGLFFQQHTRLVWQRQHNNATETTIKITTPPNAIKPIKILAGVIIFFSFSSGCGSLSTTHTIQPMAIIMMMSIRSGRAMWCGVEI